MNIMMSPDELTKLRVNPDWASLPLFDRTGWTRVRFGDVVTQLKEQVDPVAEGVERYVAGEHMETENIHISQWGNVGDGYLGPAFIRHFRKGQVLYGSRRTYLKKVAVAEWDGVTANTTFVLQASEDRLLQDLLPWLMLSERFTKHSVQESKGSTNPYINFPDIAKFEFDLPPIDQQRRLADVLLAAADCLRRQDALLTSARQQHSQILEWCFSPDRSAKLRLAELCGAHGIRIGPFGSQLHAHEYVSEGVPVVMPADLAADEVVPDRLSRITNTKAGQLSSHRLEEGDILLPRRGNLRKRGFIGKKESGWICGTGTLRIRYPDPSRRRLLFYALSRPSVSDWLERNAVGTTMPNINSTIVGNIHVSWPQDVDSAQQKIEDAELTLKAVTTHIRSLRQLVLVLCNGLTFA